MTETPAHYNDPLLIVQYGLPNLSAAALDRFVGINPRWNGAHWADVLEVLMDTDADPEGAEELFDEFGDTDPQLFYAVANTLHWADPDTPLTAEQVRDTLDLIAAAQDSWHEVDI